jgi:phage tail-like protein
MKPEDVARLLPEIFQRALEATDDSPLRALVEVMTMHLDRVDQTLGALDATFDPLRTRDEFVPYLASWIAVEASDSGSLGALRLMVRRATEIAHRRGSRQALVEWLETATGLRGFAVVDDPLLEFHVHVRCPAGARAQHVLIERLVAAEVPAYVTSTLVFEAS